MPSASPPPQQIEIADLLARYAHGEYTTVAARLDEVLDFSSLESQFERAASRWIAAAPAQDVGTRTLVAGTVALEIGRAAVETDWLAARPLLEWACVLLRRGPPLPAERLWHLASIALASRARDTRLLLGEDGPDLYFAGPRSGQPLPALANPRAPYGWKNIDHLTHAERRFPAEARYRLARAFAQEPELENVAPRDNRWPRTYWRVAVRDDEGRAAVRRYQALIDDPEVGAEVQLRTGSLWLRVGDPLRAIDHLSRADSLSQDPFVKYLARYFAAEANELLGRTALATEAYRAALGIVPGAQSGVVRLSARLYLEGRRAEADELVSVAFAMAPRPPDPWRLYSYGDFREWPTLIAALRARLQ